jgi:prophage regulatory protein
MVDTIQIPTDIPNIGFLRLPQILKFIPIGKSTWWQWVAIGKAPKSVKLGPGITAWKIEDIRQLIVDLQAADS